MQVRSTLRQFVRDWSKEGQAVAWFNIEDVLKVAQRAQDPYRICLGFVLGIPILFEVHSLVKELWTPWVEILLTASAGCLGCGEDLNKARFNLSPGMQVRKVFF